MRRDALSQVAINMRNATAKALFESARAASEEARDIKDYLDTLEAAATKARTQRYEPGASPSYGDRIGGSVCGMVDSEARLRRKTEANYALIDFARLVLYGDQDGLLGLDKRLGTREANAIWHRYLGNETWNVVGKHIGKSNMTALRYVRNGLAAIDSQGIVREATRAVLTGTR